MAAQRKATARRLRPKQAVIAADRQLQAVIQEKLSSRWSPQQISGWLRLHHPEKKRWHVCHETIYQALYLQARGGLKRQVQESLLQGRARRKPRTGVQERKRRFVEDMVMISGRPAEVADRAVPGHWKGDLIIGTNRSAIGTLVERSSRSTILVHLPRLPGYGQYPRVKNGPALAGYGASAMAQALTPAVTQLPAQLRKTLTWDRGKELSDHAQFALETGTQVYFADPHSRWQRPTNENTNGVIRQCFPKGTDL